MLNESELNKRFMPYVSRAKAYGGPSVLQAVGPALLTKNWQKNSESIRDSLTGRFGTKLMLTTTKREVVHFVSNNLDFRSTILERYISVYEQTTATA